MLKHTEERTYGRSACKYIKSLFSFFLLKYKKLTIGVKARPSTKEEREGGGEEEENKQEGYSGDGRPTVQQSVKIKVQDREAGFGFILTDKFFFSFLLSFFFFLKKEIKSIIDFPTNFKPTPRR